MSDSPKLISSAEVFHSDYFSLQTDQLIIPGRNEYEYSWLKGRDGVAIVALDANMDVCLLREYKHPLGKKIWTIPAGGIDEDEMSSQHILDAAKRELAEEANLTALSWLRLGIIYPMAATSNVAGHLFLARDLAGYDKLNRDENEIIEIHTLPFEKAVNMVFDGSIIDAWATSAILYANHYLETNTA